MNIRSLDQTEREVIGAVLLSPQKSIPTLQDELGLRAHKIRYILNKAFSKGLLKTRCFINLGKLGLMQFEVFCNLKSKDQKHREKLIQNLQLQESISWIGEFGGNFQLGFNVCARNTHELLSTLQQFELDEENTIVEKEVAIRVSLDYLGKPYLSNSSRQNSHLSYETTNEIVKIDSVDHQILHAMMNISPIAKTQLSKATNIPSSTLDYRIEKLQEKGIIVGYYNSLKTSSLGIQSFLIFVGVRSNSTKLYEELSVFCKEHKNISILVRTIGNWDYEIAVDVLDPRDASTLSQDILHSFPSFIRYTKVIPSFAYLKVKEYPFVHMI